MKVVISCTEDSMYSYFIPITTWVWNKLGVGVVLFLPLSSKGELKIKLGLNCMRYEGEENNFYYFDVPKHKESTAAQCSRLYGSCLDLPEEEILITSDVDMAVFNGDYIKQKWASFDIYGADLVPSGQIPMCFISATVKDWRKRFNLNGVTYQQALNKLFVGDECQDYRACRWSVDQEQAYKNILQPTDISLSVYNHYRANPGTQFATRRYDRDDAFILDRLSPDTIDFHMNRPGYEPQNFDIILKVLQYHYPQEDFTWLINYTQEYINLL